MQAKRQRALLAASVAGILAAAGGTLFGQTVQAVEEGNVHCYGINKCKGTGACGGKAHSCAGQNECNGQAWLETSEDLCLKINGGRLTAEPEEES